MTTGCSAAVGLDRSPKACRYRCYCCTHQQCVCPSRPTRASPAAHPAHSQPPNTTHRPPVPAQHDLLWDQAEAAHDLHRRKALACSPRCLWPHQLQDTEQVTQTSRVSHVTPAADVVRGAVQGLSLELLLC
jgi:hypothetical protein